MHGRYLLVGELELVGEVSDGAGELGVVLEEGGVVLLVLVELLEEVVAELGLHDQLVVLLLQAEVLLLHVAHRVGLVLQLLVLALDHLVQLCGLLLVRLVEHRLLLGHVVQVLLQLRDQVVQLHDLALVLLDVLLQAPVLLPQRLRALLVPHRHLQLPLRLLQQRLQRHVLLLQPLHVDHQVLQRAFRLVLVLLAVVFLIPFSPSHSLPISPGPPSASGSASCSTRTSPGCP